MIKFRWIYTLIPYSILCGSVNEPLRWEWETGYRNDTLHWHLKNPADRGDVSYSERYRDLQYWENALTLRAIYRDIAIFVRGSFGSFGQGSLKQKYANLNFTPETPIFSWLPSSWNSDCWGYFGYSVNLTADRIYHVILIPMIGYGLNIEQLNSDGLRTFSGSAIFPAQSFSMTTVLPGKERMCWFGPLFGGVFIIQPGGRLQFEAGYAYHRLHLRFRMKRKTKVSLYSANGDLMQINERLEKVKIKDGSNLAHTGWGRVDYFLFDNWRVGLETEIQYFGSRILDAAIKNEATSERSSQKFKARWTAISGTFVLSRTF